MNVFSNMLRPVRLDLIRSPTFRLLFWSKSDTPAVPGSSLVADGVDGALEAMVEVLKGR